MTDSVSSPRTRANFLPWSKMVELHRFGGYAADAFPTAYGVYLVGSAITRPDYRDVDIRLIFPDDEFDRLFGPLTDPRYENACWNAHCIAWTHFGQSITGLVIDFQIDQATWANDLFSQKNGCERQALGSHVKGPA